MTGNYSLILPLMGGNILSWAIARQFRPIAIYDALLLDDGITLKHMTSYRSPDDYLGLPVSAVMTHDVIYLPITMTSGEALRKIRHLDAHHHIYTVVDDEGMLQGVVSCSELKKVNSEHPISEMVDGQEVHFVHPKDSIRIAKKLMRTEEIERLPVVSALDDKLLQGMITVKDIARQKSASEM